MVAEAGLLRHIVVRILVPERALHLRARLMWRAVVAKPWWLSRGDQVVAM